VEWPTHSCAGRDEVVAVLRYRPSLATGVRNVPLATPAPVSLGHLDSFTTSHVNPLCASDSFRVLAHTGTYCYSGNITRLMSNTVPRVTLGIVIERTYCHDQTVVCTKSGNLWPRCCFPWSTPTTLVLVWPWCGRILGPVPRPHTFIVITGRVLSSGHRVMYARSTRVGALP